MYPHHPAPPPHTPTIKSQGRNYFCATLLSYQGASELHKQAKAPTRPFHVYWLCSSLTAKHFHLDIYVCVCVYECILWMSWDWWLVRNALAQLSMVVFHIFPTHHKPQAKHEVRMLQDIRDTGCRFDGKCLKWVIFFIFIFPNRSRTLLLCSQHL